jgi:archaellum biogenesis protein FlaJ (TadC family)
MGAMKEFGKAFVPENIFGFKVRANLRKYLLTAGYPKVPYDFFGILFLATAAITYFIFMGLVYPEASSMNFLVGLVVLFVAWAGIQLLLVFIVCFMIYFFLDIRVYKRTKEIESKLADFLVLVSTNLKGGLSLEQGLWAAIRPEFGLLAEEMTLVSKRVMTGNDLTEALNEFIEKYNSPLLQRNFSLIIGEVETGGKIVVVIDKVIESLKKMKALKDEMSASAVSYMIFIGVIVLAVAPALFALAYRLLFIITSFTSSIGSSMSGTGIANSINFNTDVDTGLFKNFSIWALATISIFSSMIISIINKGDIKGGLKYIPAFTIVSIVFYLIFMAVLETVFGTVF